MRVTVVLQDKLVAKAKKMFRKKTLSGLLNSCLADWIAQMSKKQQGSPSWWKEEKEFIRKLMEKGTIKRKRKWRREDLYKKATWAFRTEVT